MKILLAQINPIVGALEYNFAKVKSALEKHGAANDLIVFPELTLTGYPPNDLLLRKGFVEEQMSYLEDVRKLTFGLKSAVLIGAVTHNKQGVGKPLHNSALAFVDGKEVMLYHKQLLPTYNIFDENRYFQAGDSEQDNYFNIEDKLVGVLICEDCWNDEAICDAPLYPTNPVQQTMVNNSVDVLVTLNASPSDVGKHELRYSMYKTLSAKYSVPIVYVNQVGGQDSLVFDGNSFAVSDGHLYTALGFQESFYQVDVSKNANLWPNNLIHTTPSDKYELMYQHLRLGLKDYVTKNGFKSVVVGSSGGIDSAVVLALAKDVLGADKVTAITMPAQYSSKGSVNDSVTLCKNLSVTLYHRDITEETNTAIRKFVETFAPTEKDMVLPKRITIENLQPRIRMRILMEYSNEFGALVLNTTNKSEASVGYGTIFGDVAGGLAVLLDLYKMEVYGLAEWFNKWKGDNVIPRAIIDKAPSAELWEGQKDTDSLPPYPVLDALLRLYLERDLLSRKEIEDNKALIEHMTMAEIRRILKMVDGAEYKRRMAPPCIRVHKRAFGFGRNLPITQKHNVSFENVL